MKTFYFPRNLLRLISHVLEHNCNSKCSPFVVIVHGFNLSQPSSKRTTRFNTQKFCILPTMHLCVFYGFQNKQLLFLHTVLTYRFFNRGREAIRTGFLNATDPVSSSRVKKTRQYKCSRTRRLYNYIQTLCTRQVAPVCNKLRQFCQHHDIQTCDWAPRAFHSWHWMGLSGQLNASVASPKEEAPRNSTTWRVRHRVGPGTGGEDSPFPTENPATILRLSRICSRSNIDSANPLYIDWTCKMWDIRHTYRPK
jgi:hypothetical protein